MKTPTKTAATNPPTPMANMYTDAILEGLLERLVAIPGIAAQAKVTEIYMESDAIIRTVRTDLVAKAASSEMSSEMAK
jgi:hypothetical protein